MQVTCIKVGYNSFNVMPAKDMYQTASVMSNAKFSRLVPSCRNTSSTVCRIILLSTLLLLSSGRHSIRNVLFGVSQLPTSTLMYFCLSTSTLSTLKNTFLSGSACSTRKFSSFWDTNGATLALAAVSEGKVFLLQKTEILKQHYLVYGVEYLLLEMKRYFFLEVRSIEMYIGLLTLRAACRY